MRPSHFKIVTCMALLLSANYIFAQNVANAKSVVKEETSSVKDVPAVQNNVPTKPYVDRMAICLDIKENEPDVIDSVFPPEVKRLYCFTAIKGAGVNNEIQHRWYYNDELQASVSLKINSPSWRTYSAKSIPSVYTGEWIVAVVNSKNEEVIKTCKFHIK